MKCFQLRRGTNLSCFSLNSKFLHVKLKYSIFITFLKFSIYTYSLEFELCCVWPCSVSADYKGERRSTCAKVMLAIRLSEIPAEYLFHIDNMLHKAF